MKAPQFLFFAFVWLSPVLAHAADVPRTVIFCNMEVHLSAEAQEKVQGYVNDITQSPRYFNEMVKRAHTFLPFVEEALKTVGVPDDLKYLCIQESALRPDVVSTSQAVGFWQFKEETAREFGLVVDDKVDERMHIYRSSEAAGRYLLRAHRDFDNWVYAVMAYFHGFTGAIQYTDPRYYGARSMTLDADFHWYPLKAIAHKIAYEEAVNLRQRPLVALIPHSTNGETIVKNLLDSHQGVDEETFFLYNKWIRDRRRLPKEGLFTYYVPQSADFYTGHQEDPVKIQIANGGVPITFQPREAVGTMDTFGDLPLTPSPEATRPGTGTSQQAQPIANMAGVFRAADPGDLPELPYVVFETIYDLHYGEEFVLYNGRIGMPELAERLGVRLGQLLMWNGLTPGQRPATGKILYLTSPKKAQFHVVEPGESISSIAEFHRTSANKIVRSNRLLKEQPMIYVGQKLYLRGSRPKDEKIIILQHREDGSMASNQPNSEPRSQSSNEGGTRHVPPLNTPPANTRPTSSQPSQPANTSQLSQTNTGGAGNSNASGSQNASTEWINHTVRPGETLWQIAQKYSTRVEIIKRINNLSSDNIQVGQVLKVMSRTAP